MTAIDYVLTFLLIASQILYGLMYARANSYFKRTGDNLATKEDIGEITKEVEKVKLTFEQIKHEHNTRFATLHTMRFKVIVKLYKKVVRLQRITLDLTATFKPVKQNFEQEEEARIQEYVDAFNDLLLYFQDNEIFFSKTTFNVINNLLQIIRTKTWEYHEPKRFTNYGITGQGSNEYYMDALKSAANASEYIRNEFPKFMETLKEEFQTIIGVEAA
jgi:hypothetical protein